MLLMPFLGGSQREWTETVGLMSGRHRCITIDLPGFGAASEISGYSVSDMADAVIELLSSLRPGRYVLVGHSMAGKVSAVVTRRLLADELSMAPPVAIILVAPSPPGPEPMSDSKRREMLEALGDGPQLRLGVYGENDRPAAEEYVLANVARPLQDLQSRRTVDDVLKMKPQAWTAWLDSGSREDWSQFVGIIDLPALVVTGIDDEALGLKAQRSSTLPHFPQALVTELQCSHLIPIEKPDELASLILKFIERHSDRIPLVTLLNQQYRTLIESDRVSPQTKEVLLDRLHGDTPAYEPVAFTGDEMETLRHVLARVIPQADPMVPAIDIAVTLAKNLAEEKGDGWRFATLPDDLEAYRAGLGLLDEFSTTLSAVPFGRLSPAEQDSILEAVASGRICSARFDLLRWFEDLRADATQIYVSHPQTLARIGYSGIADDQNGFVQLGIGKREAWEPEPL